MVNLHPLSYLADAITLATKIEEHDEIKPARTYQQRNTWDRQLQNPRKTALDRLRVFLKRVLLHSFNRPRKKKIKPKIPQLTKVWMVPLLNVILTLIIALFLENI